MKKTTLAALALLAASAHAQTPTDVEIRKILAERVDKYKQATGIIVGLISPQGRRIITYGTPALNDPRPLNGETVYEIGSITKVFTSLLLTDMVQRGEVALTDPVAKFLPATVRVPERAGKQITLQDLSTHTSGLPREFPAATVEDLYTALATVQLTRDIGTHYEYSNLGVSLLGQALALRVGTDYESLLRVRILDPLGLSNTRFTLTTAMSTSLATGYAYDFTGMHPAPRWDSIPMNPAGGLLSNANDLLTFFAAFLGYTETPLKLAMSAMLGVQRPAGDMLIALGWHLGASRNCSTPFTCKVMGLNLINHRGGTTGYQTYLAFDPAARTGVVVLSNAGYGAGVQDVGMHLLDPKIYLTNKSAFKLPALRKPIPLEPAALDVFTGRYRFDYDGDIWTFRREGDHLVMSHPYASDAELLADGPHNFFFKTALATVEFKSIKQGKATELRWQFDDQKPQTAKRIE